MSSYLVGLKQSVSSVKFKHCSVVPEKTKWLLNRSLGERGEDAAMGAAEIGVAREETKADEVRSGRISGESREVDEDM